MSNYPTGTSALDPKAPWNAPDTVHADGIAYREVCGGNLELTTETLGEFLYATSETRTRLLTNTDVLCGPISTAELLSLMLDRRNTDVLIAAATRELASRYLDDGFTRKVIAAEVERVMGVAA
jgi:hypothetical protein